MTTQEQFNKAIAHIEQLCDKYYTLTGCKLVHEEDARIHVNRDGVWFDGDFIEEVTTQPEQNYAIRWTRTHEAYFLGAVRAAQEVNEDDTRWAETL